MLLGTALLAYSFGLRHAVDADHIAAIDNVTRKLMQEGKRPVSVGLFFALGHSTWSRWRRPASRRRRPRCSGRLEQFREIGGVIGTLVSALFLFAIAIANLVILRVGLAHLPARARRRPLCRGRPRRRCCNDAACWRACSGRCSGWSTRAGTCSRSASCSGWASTPRPRSALLGLSAAAGRQRPVDLVDPGVPGPVRRRHVADRHDRRRADARRLWLGLREADAQALLQPHHHLRVGGRRRRGRRHRGARPARRTAGPVGRVLGCDRGD